MTEFMVPDDFDRLYGMQVAAGALGDVERAEALRKEILRLEECAEAGGLRISWHWFEKEYGWSKWQCVALGMDIRGGGSDQNNDAEVVDGGKKEGKEQSQDKDPGLEQGSPELILLGKQDEASCVAVEGA